MNTLDINACNVQEMDVAEMQQIEGGLIMWVAKAAEYVWKGLVGIGIVAAAGNAIEDFKEGWDSVECGC
jgi:hypothetical protein